MLQFWFARVLLSVVSENVVMSSSFKIPKSLECVKMPFFMRFLETLSKYFSSLSHVDNVLIIYVVSYASEL